jgi:hypothetical protein
VTTPNYRSLWPVMEQTVDFLGVAPKIAGAEHITRFQPRALRQLLLEAGLGLQYFGTIHTLGPFLAIASQKWEYRRLAREIDNRFSFGMILVAVAVKP